MAKLDPNQRDNAEEYDDLYEDLYGEPAHSTRHQDQARGYRPKYEQSTRRPSAERDTAFNVWMWMIEGATGVLEEVRHNDLGLSEDFWVHAGAARRESLLAMRAVLDQMIDGEEAQQAEEREQRRARRGGIQVD
jgi:hypothetical protein